MKFTGHDQAAFGFPFGFVVRCVSLEPNNLGGVLPHILI